MMNMDAYFGGSEMQAMARLMDIAQVSNLKCSAVVLADMCLVVYRLM